MLYTHDGASSIMKNEIVIFRKIDIAEDIQIETVSDKYIFSYLWILDFLQILEIRCMYDVKVEEKLSRGTNSTKRTGWGEKGESMDVWMNVLNMYDLPLGKWLYVAGEMNQLLRVHIALYRGHKFSS